MTAYRRRLSPLAAALLLIPAAGCGAPAASGPTAGGGTITVTWQGNPQTIDPRRVYDGEDWNIARALYVGLYSENPDLTLQPELATALPAVSDHGLVYTVHLKRARWSNGQPVTAADFVFALRTELSPAFASPDDYLWYMLKGASAYEAGRSTALGVEALGPRTLRFTLNRPFSAFPYVLAVPASDPVYPGAVSRISTDPVTDGPYRLASWQEGVQLVLSRNPDYFRPHAYPDRVVMDFNVSPSVGILRVQDHQASLVGDGIPSADYVRLMGNPATRADIARGFPPAVILLALNTRVAPFNHLRVREAVEMAINKPALLQLLNDRGRAANGVLPPNLPGFGNRDIAPVYPYSPARAKALLATAGYPHGFSTELGLASEQAGRNAIGTAVQADLARIGIRVDLKPLPQEATAMARMPMLTYSWYMDYPDPSDFINGFCTSPAVVGGSNPAFLNDPGLDALEARAESLPLGPGRVALYRRIDQRVMQDAAYVPLYYPELTEFHSPSVHGIRPVGYFPAIYSHLTVSGH